RRRHRVDPGRDPRHHRIRVNGRNIRPPRCPRDRERLHHPELIPDRREERRPLSHLFNHGLINRDGRRHWHRRRRWHRIKRQVLRRTPAVRGDIVVHVPAQAERRGPPRRPAEHRPLVPDRAQRPTRAAAGPTNQRIRPGAYRGHDADPAPNRDALRGELPGQAETQTHETATPHPPAYHDQQPPHSIPTRSPTLHRSSVAARSVGAENSLISPEISSSIFTLCPLRNGLYSSSVPITRCPMRDHWWFQPPASPETSCPCENGSAA